MIRLFDMLIPQELNPEEQKKRKQLEMETKKIGKKSCESKSRFEKSLLELEEILKENKGNVDHNSMAPK